MITNEEFNPTHEISDNGHGYFIKGEHVQPFGNYNSPYKSYTNEFGLVAVVLNRWLKPIEEVDTPIVAKFMEEIDKITDDGRNMRQFSTGATRNTDDGKLDFEGFFSPLALEEFAKYMHKNRMQADGELRSGDNWQKGIPVEAYMKSMYRHFFDTWKKYRGLDTKEDQVSNLCGLMFNVQGMLHELLKNK